MRDRGEWWNLACVGNNLVNTGSFRAHRNPGGEHRFNLYGQRHRFLPERISSLTLWFGSWVSRIALQPQCAESVYPNDGVGTRHFAGSIDEVESSDVALSAGWIATEYNNQSSPSTFIGLGGQQVAAEPVLYTFCPVTVRAKGVRIGNWLSMRQAQTAEHKGLYRDRAILAALWRVRLSKWRRSRSRAPRFEA